ncbi:MAG: hypothetical protein QI223_02605 [Candidatus Korarchaeota archaeon]|nr:hypothetical protein [Candidatus Korarchaeota archaeon]
MPRPPLISVFLALLLVVGAAVAWADGVDFSLTWAFDSWASDQAGEVVYVYEPGETAIVNINLTNQCDLTLEVVRVRLIAEWMAEGEYAELAVDPPVKVTPERTATLGRLAVRIPRDVRPGAYYYEFEVDVRVPSGDEWRVETHTVPGFRDLLVAPGRARLDVDYDTEEGFTFRSGGEVRFRVHVVNEGTAATTVEYVRIYPGWPGEKYRGEFFDCLEPGREPLLGPEEELNLECGIPIPSDVPEGRYVSSLEVGTVTEILGGRYREFWSPGYGVDYEVLRPEPFIEKYREALGILTATASAVSVVIGVYKKWKGGSKG